MESVKISPKKCKIAMALAGHHRAVIIDHWLDFTNHNIQAMGKTLVPKNITGSVYNTLLNMYSHTKCNIKFGKKQRTDYFTYGRDVRQGCVLSFPSAVQFIFE